MSISKIIFWTLFIFFIFMFSRLFSSCCSGHGRYDYRKEIVVEAYKFELEKKNVMDKTHDENILIAYNNKNSGFKTKNNEGLKMVGDKLFLTKQYKTEKYCKDMQKILSHFGDYYQCFENVLHYKINKEYHFKSLSYTTILKRYNVYTEISVYIS